MAAAKARMAKTHLAGAARRMPDLRPDRPDRSLAEDKAPDRFG